MSKVSPHPPAPAATAAERRAAVRQVCQREALTHSPEAPQQIYWGAVVRDVSADGLGLRLCYPFHPGTHLAIEIDLGGSVRALLARVVHVREQGDGTWFLGCELASRLADAEVEALK
jgi:hypothetical protein